MQAQAWRDCPQAAATKAKTLLQFVFFAGSWRFLRVSDGQLRAVFKVQPFFQELAPSCSSLPLTTKAQQWPGLDPHGGSLGPQLLSFFCLAISKCCF